MKLVEGFDSNYRFIQVAAKRARQLQGGARPQVDADTHKTTRLAMEEIKAGKVEWTIPEKSKSAAEVAAEALGGTATVEPTPTVDE
jgi:DNA-directed RNA polymerase subunit omega